MDALKAARRWWRPRPVWRRRTRSVRWSWAVRWLRRGRPGFERSIGPLTAHRVLLQRVPLGTLDRAARRHVDGFLTEWSKARIFYTDTEDWLDAVADPDENHEDDFDLARLCQRAENEFVGANCGIMDQFISANGAEDHALLLDCRDLTYKLAPIPANMALVIANTMVKHSVAGDGYTTRRSEVEEACRILARHRPEIKFLRDATVADLEAWGHEIPPNALKRARHVITENRRTLDAAEALLRHDLTRLGELMHEAHVSYSKDFEGSCVEADIMVDLAQDLPGLIGARLTGGGFGGCTINVVESSSAKDFAAALKQRYQQATGINPEIHICHASDGAHRII